VGEALDQLADFTVDELRPGEDDVGPKAVGFDDGGGERVRGRDDAEGAVAREEPGEAITEQRLTVG
jgi:hypothetical protein